MAKGVGLDAGAYEVKVVELEGSYRKPRLSKVSIDRVPAVDATEEGRADVEAESALHALKDAHVARDGVTLGFPSREAVLRTMTVPFVGQDAIRKVIKFEAEGEIHSHNVDDMIVDFHTLEERDEDTRVLIAAVPKRPLRALLEALESVGIEPERVDLDAMALFRVAEWAGCFEPDAPVALAEGGSDAPVAAELPATGISVRLVLDVGARSTRVLAVAGGQILDMRALRVGGDTIAEELAAAHGIALDQARTSVVSAFDPTDDFVIEEEALDASGEVLTGAEEPGPATRVAGAVVPAEAVVAARERFLARLRRELMRFLASLPRVTSVERVYVTGSASRLEGIETLLEETFGCAPTPLDVLGRMSHDLEPEEADELAPRLAVAIGLALGQMGGPQGFDFRREELAFRRRFDRIKFPLAIACMLAVFLLFIHGLRQYQKLQDLGRQYGETFSVEEGSGGRSASAIKATFWGHVNYVMGRLLDSRVGRLDARERDALVQTVLQTDTFDRLDAIRGFLQGQLRKKREETGIYQDLQLPSGAFVLNAFGETIKRVEKDIAPFLVTRIHLSIPANEEQRHLTFEIAISGPGFRQRLERVRDAFSARFDDPAAPFAGFGTGQAERVFSGGAEGALYEIKLQLKEEFGEGQQG